MKLEKFELFEGFEASRTVVTCWKKLNKEFQKFSSIIGCGHIKSLFLRACFCLRKRAFLRFPVQIDMSLAWIPKSRPLFTSEMKNSQ